MEQIVKAFIGLFITIVIVFLSAGLINAAIQSKNADSYLDSICTQWESSNFTMSNDELMRSVKAEGIEIVRLQTTREPQVGRVKYATVSLTYKFNVVGIGLQEERTISKSIR